MPYIDKAKTDDWASPKHVIDSVIQEFGHIDLDPASSKHNAVAGRFFTKETNGLEQMWIGDLVYVNPPYGRVLLQWVGKAIEEYEAKRAKKIVMLLPSRTCTRWFHLLYGRKDVEIRFYKGRLKYGDGTKPSPFPSILVIIG